jgi:radical SAM superfamily enzyme YgiQ (UPF0313 family)
VVNEIILLEQLPLAEGTNLFDRMTTNPIGPGLLQLEAVLEQIGYKVRLGSIKDIKDIDRILKRHPNTDMVGISCITANSLDAYKALDHIKNAYDIPTIIGGCHVTFLPDEALPHADAVFVGETEISLPEFLKTVEKNGWPEKRKERIWGAIFDNGRIRIDPRYMISDLDSLPHIKYRYTVVKTTSTPLDKLLAKVSAKARLSTSRGCPFACEFCQSSRKEGMKWRANSAEYVVDSMELFHEKGANMIQFVDDNFSLDTRRMEQFCNLIKERKLGISWAFFGRLDWITSNPKLFHKMVECGCMSVFVGIESGSQKVLDGMKKKLSVNEIKKGFEIIHSEKKVFSTGSMIMGAYNDTIETIDQSIDFIQKLNPHFAIFTMMTPYPGAPLYDRLVSENRIKTFDWSKYTGENLVFDHPFVENDLVQYKLYEVYKNYYSRSEWQEKINSWDVPDEMLPSLPGSIKNWLFRRVISNVKKKGFKYWSKVLEDYNKEMEQDTF